MKKIVQAIARLPLKRKLIILAGIIAVLLVIGYLIRTREEPEYAIHFGKLYAVKGDKARLIGNYWENYEIVYVKNKKTIIKVINWGDKETVFVVNGEEYRMGPNGTVTVEDDLIVLKDDSGKKKKVNEYGKQVR